VEGDALLIIYYDLVLVDSVIRETMGLYRWDAGTEICEREGGGVTSIRDYMTGGFTRLGPYAILVRAWAAAHVYPPVALRR
jgi:hypothetical protein